MRGVPIPQRSTADISTLACMTTATLPSRPRLRRAFTGGGHLALAPTPGDPPQIETRDEATAARLALALLITRHGTSRSAKYPYRYQAVDSGGNVLAAQGDETVLRLAAALRGTDCGEAAQHAALETVGLTAG